MKTEFIIGLVVVAIGATCVYAYLKNNNNGERKHSLDFNFLKKILHFKFQPEIREVESISMRSFGAWIKEHDFPSFAGYRFFIAKGQDVQEFVKKKNPKDLYAHGFCITDSDFNIIDVCIFLSNNIEENFADKIKDNVCEIKIH